MSARIRVRGLCSLTVAGVVSALLALPAQAVGAVPNPAPDAATVSWGDTVTINVAANDTGLADTPVFYSIFTYPSLGDVAINRDTGIATYQAFAFVSGTDHFSYMVEDADGDTGVAEVTVTVTAGTSVVARPDAYQVFTGELTPLDVTDNDETYNTTVSSVSIVTPPLHGSASVNGLQIRYTATAPYTGADQLTYRVTDSSGQSDTAVVSLTVQASPPPVAVDDLGLIAISGQTTSLPVTGNDSWATIGGSITIITPPAHGTAEPISAALSIDYTPTAGYYGSDSLVYRLTDGRGRTDDATVTISVVPAPVTDLQAAGAGTGKVILTWTNPAGTDGIVVRYGTGSAPQTPTEGTGVPVSGAPETVTVSGLTDGTTYFFSVFAKVGTAISGAASVELSPFTCPNLAPDLDAASGLITGSSWVACSGPDANEAGNALTTVLPKTGATQALMTSGDKAVAIPPSDGGGEGSNNGTGSRGAYDVSIYRLDLNVPSGANCLRFNYVFASEEYPEFVGSGFNDGFLAQLDQNVWEVNNSTISATGNFAQLSNGEFISVNSPVFGPGATVYTDATNGTGYDGMSVPLTASTPITPGGHSIYLSIFDAGDHILDSAAFIDNLRVVNDAACTQGSNQPPVATDDSGNTTGTTPVTVNVLSNDTDPEGDTLSVASPSPTATNGTVSCTSSACTYTANAGFSGTDSFNYTLSDGRGGTDTGTVTITVAAAPGTPVAVDDTATTAANTAVIINVLANDSDPDNDPLSITSPSPSATNGTATCSASSCTFTPTTGFTGTGSFTYTISDGQGGSDSATVTVTVTNKAPVAVDDTASTNVGTAKVVNVLANDTDPDNHSLTVTSASPTALHGTVSCSATTCTYTPNAGYTGPDSFTYTINDGHGGSDTGQVTMTVLNRQPVANPDSATTTLTDPVGIAVLTNDTDPDGHSLTVTSAAPSALNGTVVCTSSVCTYTADSGYAGTDSFTYTISDGHGGTASALVSVTVTSNVVSSISIAASSASVVWPAQVTITGVVRNASSAVVQGASIQLWAKPSGEAYALVRTVTSNASGAVTATHRPSSETTYQWRSDSPSVSSPETAVTVKPIVTISRTPSPLAVGDVVTISGKSTPTRVGTPIDLQRLSGSTWSTIDSSTFTQAVSTTTPTAVYSFDVTSTTSKVVKYRVRIPADAGRLEVISAIKKVTFYAAKITGVHATGDEYASIKNTGTVSLSLNGWKLKSNSKIFTLPNKTIAAGATLRIHTGSGTNNATNIYLGKPAMWGNSHDTAKLIDTHGFQVSSFNY